MLAKFLAFLPGTLLLSVGACQAQTSLTQYLNLTGAQRSNILNLNGSYTNDWVAQQLKLLAAQNELGELAVQAGADQLQLGQLAITAETIRRDRVAKELVLRKQLANLLTPAQVAALQTLAASAVLAPLATDAACAYLVSPFVPQFVGVPSSLLSAIDQPAPPALAAFSVPDIPPAPTGSFCGSSQFPISVREYLALTDAQVTSLFSASASYNDFYARKQNRLTDIQLAIADLTASPAADSLALGSLYIEMGQIGQQIKEKAAQLRDAALSQLNSAQSSQVKTLQTVQDYSNAGLFANAIGCKLLVLPAGASTSGADVTGTYSNCRL